MAAHHVDQDATRKPGFLPPGTTTSRIAVACAVTLALAATPTMGLHTDPGVWDVDQVSYPTNADCNVVVRHCNTIQAAVDAALPGDTIVVQAGTYAENVVVSKTLTLQGAQAGVDPRPMVGGRSGGETVVVSSGTAMLLGADNVVVDGFTFESHAISSTPNVVYALNAANPTIVYNVVYNVNPGAASNEGIKVRNTMGTGATVERNYIHDIPAPGDSINFDTVTGGSISFNEVRNDHSDNAAIYVYGSTDTTIEANLVDTTSQNDGIKLGDKGGDDEALVGGVIIGNEVRNTAQDGIAVYTSHVLVQGNLVTGSTSENGAIHLQFAITDITVASNCVLDNTLSTGKYADAAGILVRATVDAASVHITGNNIAGNTPFGVTNHAAASLDAADNWWGDAGGPSGAGSGTGDAVTANVAFTPWLTEPADGTPCSPNPTTVEDCKNGGWEQYGFRNQGQCVRYVQTGKDSR